MFHSSTLDQVYPSFALERASVFEPIQSTSQEQGHTLLLLSTQCMSFVETSAHALQCLHLVAKKAVAREAADFWLAESLNVSPLLCTAFKEEVTAWSTANLLPRQSCCLVLLTNLKQWLQNFGTYMLLLDPSLLSHDQHHWFCTGIQACHSMYIQSSIMYPADWLKPLAWAQQLSLYDTTERWRRHYSCGLQQRDKEGTQRF